MGAGFSLASMPGKGHIVANSGISTKQKAALRALLAGANYAQAAVAAKVHENTISLWMRDPVFLAAIHKAESEAMSAISLRLITLIDKAANALETILDNAQARDTAKTRAADILFGRFLEIRQFAELEARIAKLEEAQHENGLSQTPG